ncbi:MAG: hypothetical protein LQ338_006250 [Usnochroma carphineum]|nr:MAG: hypothetical protein LQ338_006250 [Usnochroma carphineum]
MASKAAQYCTPKVSDGTGLLLLCEAELGEEKWAPSEVPDAPGLNTRMGGYVSLWGKGRFGPMVWKDAGCVHEDLEGVLMPNVDHPPTDTGYEGPGLNYNEYVVYNEKQVRLRYLLQRLAFNDCTACACLYGALFWTCTFLPFDSDLWRLLFGGDLSSLNHTVEAHPRQPPLLDQTIGDHFASIVSKFGDRAAVISRHQRTRLTYNGLDLRSNALARGLQDLGVKKGDRVAGSETRADEVKATYAVFKLGAVLMLKVYPYNVPLNPAFNTQQVIAALSHLEASHLLIGAETNLPRKASRSNICLLQQIIPDLQAQKVQSEAVPSLRQIIIVDNSNGGIDGSDLRSIVNYQDLLRHGECSRPHLEESLSPDDIVNIQFTSGTTSVPKAACLSHHSILNNGKSIGDRMLLTERDIVCCPPPLFHCFGCILGYMATATHGSAIVFPAEAFDPYATLKSVQEEKCTALYGVPTMFIADLELIQNGTVPHIGFEHLRTGIAAGSSIPAELMRKLHRILNLTELTICYGMTETSPVSAMTTTDDPIEKRIDSVGRPLPHVETKIVDPIDRSRILPLGTRGELAVSGYLLMKKYWGAPEKTVEVMLPDDTGKIWMHVGLDQLRRRALANAK